MPTCVLTSPRDASWPIYGASGEIVARRKKIVMEEGACWKVERPAHFAIPIRSSPKSRTQYYRYGYLVGCGARIYAIFPQTLVLPRK